MWIGTVQQRQGGLHGQQNDDHHDKRAHDARGAGRARSGLEAERGGQAVKADARQQPGHELRHQSADEVSDSDHERRPDHAGNGGQKAIDQVLGPATAGRPSADRAELR